MRNELYINSFYVVRWGREEIIPLRRFFIYLPVVEVGEEVNHQLDETEEFIHVRFDTYFNYTRIKNIDFIGIKVRLFGFGFGFSFQGDY